MGIPLEEARGGSERDQQQDYRVLIVEDEPGITKLLDIHLQVVGGISTQSCTTGEDGLIILRQEVQKGQPFDLVITDFGLAGKMTGLLLADFVRDERLATTVYLLTGNAINFNERDLREKHGISKLFGKPFSGRELRQTVSELVQEKRVPQ